MTTDQLFDRLSGHLPFWIALSDQRLADALCMTTAALRKAQWRGALPLPVTPGPGGRKGVLLTDLVRWLSGENPSPKPRPPSIEPTHPEEGVKRRPGRPRKNAGVFA